VGVDLLWEAALRDDDIAARSLAWGYLSEADRFELALPVEPAPPGLSLHADMDLAARFARLGFAEEAQRGSPHAIRILEAVRRPHVPLPASDEEAFIFLWRRYSEMHRGRARAN
jgi:hypothetical protein